MKLLSLTIRNFGSYGGEHCFQLETHEQPIVLFGGKNGAGKTTLLEAIRLCLYGSSAVGNRVSKAEYLRYLEMRMHRGWTFESDETSITLEFEYAHGGEKHHYKVSRSWIHDGKTVKEAFTLFEDENSISHLNEDRWEDFVSDLIPPKVSELFFFDGEKIQALAQDQVDHETLDLSIKGLLGLDVVERLQTDLSIYLRQERKNAALKELVNSVKVAERQRDEIQQKYEQLIQQKAQIQSNIDYVSGKVDDLEHEIARESKGYALQRDEIKAERDRLEGEIEAIQKNIHSLAADLLPFSFVPELCLQLRTQLEHEAQYQQWLATQRWVQPKLRAIELSLRSGELLGTVNGNMSSDIRNAIANAVLEELKGLTQLPADLADIELIHHLSENEHIQLLGWIEQAIHDVPHKLREATEYLETLTRNWQQAQGALRQVPSDSVLSPLMRQLNEHQRDLELLNKQYGELDIQASALDNKQREAQRNLEKAYARLRGGERLEERLALVEKTQGVLDNYLRELTEKKVVSLQHLTTERFNQLLRKHGFVSRIEIDPKDFSVTLYDQKGKSIPKAQLSAGEKQIFAIAILWALRQLSGRPLPVIIDTPLGRLDSEHRQRLVSHYFPHTSHQVIILSTDTEIDRPFFEELSSYIARAYHLQYDVETASTFAEEGYFWQDSGYATQ